MKIFATACATVALASLAMPAMAQTTVSKAESRMDGKTAPSMTGGTTKMTALEKKQWKACMGMSDSQAANSKKCVELKDRGAGVGSEGMTNDGLPKGK